ncbi:hypothetical protein AWENTII_010601 [Aspergillus wentii]
MSTQAVRRGYSQQIADATYREVGRAPEIDEIADARGMWGAEDGTGQQRSGRSRCGNFPKGQSRYRQDIPMSMKQEPARRSREERVDLAMAAGRR